MMLQVCGSLANPPDDIVLGSVVTVGSTLNFLKILIKQVIEILPTATLTVYKKHGRPPQGPRDHSSQLLVCCRSERHPGFLSRPPPRPPARPRAGGLESCGESLESPS